jgi:hypothetical protein
MSKYMERYCIEPEVSQRLAIFFPGHMSLYFQSDTLLATCGMRIVTTLSLRDLGFWPSAHWVMQVVAASACTLAKIPFIRFR